MSRAETRGVTCLACSGLDLQAHPEKAHTGFGWCKLAAAPHFVAARMARNCADFDPAPPEVVKPRDAWAVKLPLFFERK
jgi:hypothetical protein